MGGEKNKPSSRAPLGSEPHGRRQAEGKSNFVITDIKTYTRKTQLLVAAGILIVGGIFAWGFMAYGFSNYVDEFMSDLQEVKTKVELQVKEVISSESELGARKLDGVILEDHQVDKYPVGIMIENLITVRPQSGLSQASVVYEALVEGGITRFLAVYGGGNDAEEIGPVRSARPYYVEWVAEYDALYAHCGGSPEGLSAVQVHHIKDLNQIGGAHGYYWRDSSKSAPHNLYTSTGLMDVARQNEGVKEVEPPFESWQFKDEKFLEERPAEDKFVRINFSSGISYQTEYQYDRESNTYLRFNGGIEHIDKLTNEQLSAKNVIVQYVPEVGYYPSGKGRIITDVTGEGEAISFVDGGANIGTWKKENTQDRTRFYYENGDEVELNRGTIWVEVVPVDRAVEYN